ncbi:hypothetical protein B0H13DRAFT_1920665 [Mycena leptocephala]|nr:hypothetical protein B0H13DRAFT_1920665 [Mycena leptocephala]
MPSSPSVDLVPDSKKQEHDCADPRWQVQSWATWQPRAACTGLETVQDYLVQGHPETRDVATTNYPQSPPRIENTLMEQDSSSADHGEISEATPQLEPLTGFDLVDLSMDSRLSILVFERNGGAEYHCRDIIHCGIQQFERCDIATYSSAAQSFPPAQSNPFTAPWAEAVCRFAPKGTRSAEMLDVRIEGLLGCTGIKPYGRSISEHSHIKPYGFILAGPARLARSPEQALNSLYSRLLPYTHSSGAIGLQPRVAVSLFLALLCSSSVQLRYKQLRQRGVRRVQKARTTRHRDSLVHIKQATQRTYAKIRARYRIVEHRPQRQEQWPV